MNRRTAIRTALLGAAALALPVAAAEAKPDPDDRPDDLDTPQPARHRPSDDTPLEALGEALWAVHERTVEALAAVAVGTLVLEDWDTIQPSDLEGFRWVLEHFEAHFIPWSHRMGAAEPGHLARLARAERAAGHEDRAQEHEAAIRELERLQAQRLEWQQTTAAQ